MNRERYGDKLGKIKEAGNYRELREMQLNGFLVHHDGREMLNFSSNSDSSALQPAASRCTERAIRALKFFSPLGTIAPVGLGLPP